MTNLQEIWKTIPGWEDYQASSFGLIRSIDRVSKHNYGGNCIKRGKMLKIHLSSNGYPQVSLTVNGKSKSLKVHRLVALAFIPNPDKKLTVNHKDGNKQNNHIDNLEWNTWSENQTHAIANGLAVVPFFGVGENHQAAKLNNVDVAMIKVLLNNGFTNVQISKRFNVHEVHISAIKLNKTWKHLS